MFFFLSFRYVEMYNSKAQFPAVDRTLRLGSLQNFRFFTKTAGSRILHPDLFDKVYNHSKENIPCNPNFFAS